MKLHKYMAQ